MPLIPFVKALTSDGPNKPTLPTSAGSGLIIDTGAPKPLSPGLNIGGTIIPWGLVLAGVGLLITAKG